MLMTLLGKANVYGMEKNYEFNFQKLNLSCILKIQLQIRCMSLEIRRKVSATDTVLDVICISMIVKPMELEKTI